MSSKKSASKSTGNDDATSSSSSGGGLPKALVFDLDGCVWYPEMYQLWGTGGSPFTPAKGGDLKTRSGELVELMEDTREIMHELGTADKWKDTVVAVASCCDEPRYNRLPYLRYLARSNSIADGPTNVSRSSD